MILAGVGIAFFGLLLGALIHMFTGGLPALWPVCVTGLMYAGAGVMALSQFLPEKYT
jgi:predicted branched-subunit amino acid permease